MKVSLKHKQVVEKETAPYLVDLRKQVEQDLRYLGVPFAEVPRPATKVNFMLPLDITRVTSAELSRIMGQIANQDAYLLHELAMQGVESNAVDEDYNHAEAKIICVNGDIKQKYQIEAICEQDKPLQRLKRECLRLEGVIDVIKATSDGLRAKSAVLSREISRRQLEAELAHKL